MVIVTLSCMVIVMVIVIRNVIVMVIVIVMVQSRNGDLHGSVLRSLG